MINKTSKKHDFLIKPGMRITGKWHQRQYLIKRMLGYGAIGTVYLCESGGKQAALKISENSTSMTMEVNVLKSLSKVQGNRLGPSLLDVDDWTNMLGKTFSFYVMEYVHGVSLRTFIQQQGSEWLGVFMLQLLEDLESLHKAGWIFGDLKLENLLVSSQPPKVRWIDVGGTTRNGRAIKEYTEFYDRGYWGLGSRKAEPSYDLFAFAMVLLSVAYPNQFERGKNPMVTLSKKIDASRLLSPYAPCLKKAIAGKYKTSSEMKGELVSLLYQAQKSKKDSHTIPYIIEAIGILLVAGGYYVASFLLP